MHYFSQIFHFLSSTSFKRVKRFSVNHGSFILNLPKQVRSLSWNQECYIYFLDLISLPFFFFLITILYISLHHFILSFQAFYYSFFCFLQCLYSCQHNWWRHLESQDRQMCWSGGKEFYHYKKSFTKPFFLVWHKARFMRQLVRITLQACIINYYTKWGTYYYS